jgi:hypothetical protein
MGVLSWILEFSCGFFRLVFFVNGLFGLSPFIHFIVAFIFVAIIVLLNYRYLVKTKVAK